MAKLMLDLLVLLAVSVAFTDAASTTTVVVPDLAGMLYPPSAVGRNVQFGDFTAAYPTAFEFIAPTSDTFVCSNARLCLQLKISSVFKTDPFFLYRYGANYPLVSATFDGYDATTILPLIPGNAASTSTSTSTSTSAEPTVWWFQSNATTTATSTTTAPVIDLLLRLRQRSQRLSARDQLLVHLRIELVDSRTTTSAIKAYSVYGNQRATHITRHVNSNTTQVSVSITRNTAKRDVILDDAYPLITATGTSTGTDGSGCAACGVYLDVCQQMEPCRTGVLPCLLSELKKLSSTASDSGSDSDTNAGDHKTSSGTQGPSTGGPENNGDDSSAGSGGTPSGNQNTGTVDTGTSGDSTNPSYGGSSSSAQGTIIGGGGNNTVGSGTGASGSKSDVSLAASTQSDIGGMGGDSTKSDTKTVDFLGPLATCVDNLPITTWLPFRQGLLCAVHAECALGSVSGANAGEELFTFLRLTDGSQRFTVTPTVSATDNVELTIVEQTILSTTASPHTFTYNASASLLGMYLRSFVLQQAADVSISVGSPTTSSDTLQLTLTYSNGLMLSSVGFSTTSRPISMIVDIPASAVLEYPASSPFPNLDGFIREMQARINPASDTSSEATHSWLLADQCLDCSATLFGCSRESVADRSCNYYTMTSTLGKCLLKQLPPSLFKGMMQGSTKQRPISTEISQCATEDSSTDVVASMKQASSSLECFAASRCPFGPISLVQDTHAIVLETTSYIQLLRVSLAVSTIAAFSMTIGYKVGSLVVAITDPFSVTSSDQSIQQLIEDVLTGTGIKVSATSTTNGVGTEWTLEVIYRDVFLPDTFAAKAEVVGGLVGSNVITQFVMKGAPELRIAERDNSKIFKKSSADSPSSGSSDATTPAPSKSPATSKSGSSNSPGSSGSPATSVPSSSPTTQEPSDTSDMEDVQYNYETLDASDEDEKNADDAEDAEYLDYLQDLEDLEV